MMWLTQHGVVPNEDSFDDGFVDGMRFWYHLLGILKVV